MSRDALFVSEMIDAAEQATRLIATREVSDLETDRTARDALLWNFMVLGEAASKVSDPVRVAHPEVPWRLARALRNRIVHGYWSIDLALVHATAVEILPGLIAQLRTVASALPADSDDTGGL